MVSDNDHAGHVVHDGIQVAQKGTEERNHLQRQQGTVRTAAFFAGLLNLECDAVRTFACDMCSARCTASRYCFEGSAEADGSSSSHRRSYN